MQVIYTLPVHCGENPASERVFETLDHGNIVLLYLYIQIQKFSEEMQKCTEQIFNLQNNEQQLRNQIVLLKESNEDFENECENRMNLIKKLKQEKQKLLVKNGLYKQKQKVSFKKIC